MMNKSAPIWQRLCALFLVLSLLQGCSHLVGAVRSEPIKDTPAKRTFGRYIDDQIVETKALVNLRKADPRLKESHLVVVSYNGIVLVTGQVPSEALRKKAAEVVSRIATVRRVHNELQVIGKTTMLIRSNDNWITGKIAARLALTENSGSERIKVVTENSVVYLLGLVSREEATVAAKIASQAQGVQRVVQLFEYR